MVVTLRQGKVGRVISFMQLVQGLVVKVRPQYRFLWGKKWRCLNFSLPMHILHQHSSHLWTSEVWQGLLQTFSSLRVPKVMMKILRLSRYSIHQLWLAHEIWAGLTCAKLIVAWWQPLKNKLDWSNLLANPHHISVSRVGSCETVVSGSLVSIASGDFTSCSDYR